VSDSLVGAELPQLIQALHHDNATVRRAALLLLGELAQEVRGLSGEQSAGIVKAIQEASPRVAELVRDRTPSVRLAAIEALGRIPVTSEVAMTAWDQALKDCDPAIRVAAVQAIRTRFARYADLLGRTQSRSEESVRQYEEVVASALTLLPALETTLGDRQSSVRAAALQAVHQLAAALNRFQLPEDVSLEAGDAAQRSSLPRDLPELARALVSLMPRLGSLLMYPEPANQIAAGHAFEELAQLRDPSADAQRFNQPRGSFVNPRLGIAGKEAERILTEGLRQAVPVLATVLRSAPDEVQLATLDALESLGSAAKAATPVLVASLQDPNRFVRWASARTLGRIDLNGNPAVIRGVAGLLGDEDLDVRAVASRTLREFGPAARAVAPALAQLLVGEDSALKLEALEALSAIQSTDPALIPALVIALQSPEARVRQRVPPLLELFGPAARSAAPALEAAMRDEDPHVRQSAAQALLVILAKPAK
jgi:HEAT repeat protein